MNFFKTIMNKKIYFLSVFFLLCTLAINIWFIFISFETLKSYIDLFRPEKPYQFFTNEYHFYFRVFSILVGLILVFLMILLQTKTNQYLNIIKILSSEISLLISKSKAKAHLFLQSENKSYLYIIIFVFLGGIIFRLIYLDRPVFHDEAKTFYAFVSKSWVDTVSNYYVPNNHVFHSILSRICFLLLGTGEWVFRLPVFISGCLALILCYLYARSFFNKNVAIILLALITNGIPLVSYSVNARGYMLITCCFLSLLLIVKELNKNSTNIVLCVAFIVVSSVGLWTAPVMAIPLLFVFYWFLLEGGLANIFVRAKKSFVALLLIGSLTVILYIPVILRCGIGALTSNPYVKEQTLSTVLRSLFLYFSQYWDFLTTGYTSSMSYVFILLFFIGALYHVFNSNSKNLFLALILSFGSVFFILKRLPFDRTLLFVYPVFWTFIATGIYYILRFVSNKTGQNIKTLSLTFSFVAFCYTSFICLKKNAIIDTHRNQTCVEAEKIVSDIQKNLKIGNTIETSTPLAGPIRYYLLKNNLSEEFFYWHSNGKDKSHLLQSDKVYIITRDGRNSLSSYGYTKSFSLAGFSKPKLWKQYQNTVEVYIIEKVL